MKCAKCDVEPMISHSQIIVEGDTSPEEKTAVYRKLSFQCRNPKCENYNRTIGEERIKIFSQEE